MIDNFFDKWNELKKKIDKKSDKNIFPKPWEIWYINIWINIWNESLGKWNLFKRPVLIISKLWNMFFCSSMTTKWKDSNFYFKLDENYFDKKSYIAKSQLKSVDKKRFIIKIWKLKNKDFYEIKKEIQKFIFWKSL